MKTYYAVYEIVVPNQPREVVALVCRVKYNKRDLEGYIFGYKDMEETVGPCETECPLSILDLLTPTTHEHALAWRDHCRAYWAKRAASPKLRNGDEIVFERPLRFTDGTEHHRFIVVRDPNKPRQIAFRPTSGGGLYQISRIKTRAFRLAEHGAPPNAPDTNVTPPPECRPAR